MRKVLSVFTAGLLFFGALTAFAGCEDETPEGGKQPEISAEREAEIYAAIEEAALTRFEVTTDLNLILTITGTGFTQVNGTKQKSTMKAYEQDGKLFADAFTDTYAYSKNTYFGKTTLDSTESYSVQFIRGDDSYTAKGEWKDVQANRCDFTALIEEFKSNEEVLIWSDEISTASIDGEDVQSFGELAPKADAQVAKTDDGYSVQMDIEKILKEQDESFLDDITSQTGLGSAPSVGGTVTLWLNSELNITFVEAEIDLSMTQSGGLGTNIDVSGKIEVEMTPLENMPTLSSLTGLKAHMGYEFIPKVEETGVPHQLLWLYPDGDILGDISATVTVTEKGELIIECTFTAEDGRILNDTHTYDLQKKLILEEYFFKDWELEDGTSVWFGWRYHIDYEPERGGYMSISSDHTDLGGVPIIKDL